MNIQSNVEDDKYYRSLIDTWILAMNEIDWTDVLMHYLNHAVKMWIVKKKVEKKKMSHSTDRKTEKLLYHSRDRVNRRIGRSRSQDWIDDM